MQIPLVFVQQSNIHITIQNLNVVGKNYYGLIYVSEGTNHQDVVVTYKNITLMDHK